MHNFLEYSGKNGIMNGENEEPGARPASLICRKLYGIRDERRRS